MWGGRDPPEQDPGARHAVIKAAGHLAPLEAPEAFGALLLEFLRDAELRVLS